MRPLRLAIVDDYEVVTRGLASMVDDHGDVHLVDLDDGSRREGSVDVALYDAFAKPGAGEARMRQLIEDPSIDHVVVWTWHVDAEAARCTIELGARGFIAKTLPSALLIDVLRRVRHGDVVVSPEAVSRITGDSWPGRELGVTRREIEMLALITQGHSNNEIASLTLLSINSIKSYIRSAYRKIGVTNRSHAILWGVEHGLRPTRSR